MESIDLELGELFDHDAVDVDDELEDAAAPASGYGEDEAPADGEEGGRHYSLMVLIIFRGVYSAGTVPHGIFGHGKAVTAIYPTVTLIYRTFR